MFRVYWKLAKTSIKQNRTRSFLTCLGVAVGVASLVLILSLTGSVKNVIKDEMGEIGENLLVVENGTEEQSLTDKIKQNDEFLTSNLDFSDVEIIAEISGVEAVSPVATTTNTIISDKNTIDAVEVLGTNADFMDIWGLTLRYGVFLNDENENTVVVGHRLALVLFNTDNPVGKSLTIKGEKMIVMGVLSEMGEVANLNNIDFDNTLIIGTKMAEKLGMQVKKIDVLAMNTESLGVVSEEIQAQIKDAKNGEENLVVKYGDEISYPINATLLIISGALAIISGVALVVGGIGIMNIMLLSVAERTREIGIRKAVGATSGDILCQFLLEALMLSLVGAVMGVILGYVLAFFVSIATAFAPYIDGEIIGVTIISAISVGVVFGIYPALKAARKNPIESLK